MVGHENYYRVFPPGRSFCLVYKRSNAFVCVVTRIEKQTFFVFAFDEWRIQRNIKWLVTTQRENYFKKWLACTVALNPCRFKYYMIMNSPLTFAFVHIEIVKCS